MGKLFSTESEMQSWISSTLDNTDGIAELISNIDIIKDQTHRNFSELRILQSFKTCISSLYLTTKVSENENISVKEGDILKPDFVLYAPDTESIVIVELKNISAPTRQAGTELSAYSCEIKSTIPFISDGDIVHVLISSEWPTLLRHFAMHEIFWQNKNLICLQPIAAEQGIRLKILSPSELTDDTIPVKIGKEYLGGYQICLYDDELYSKNPDRNRLDIYIEQFKAALNAMAITGNRLNSHGFAFLWKDCWSQSLAPYSITVLNFAPFQSVERFFHFPQIELPIMVKRFTDLVREYDPEGHGNTLNKITDTCTGLLDEICSPLPEGFTTWGALREIMGGRAKHIAFIGWGLFGEAYLEKLKETYRKGNISCSSTDPKLGMEVISEIVDEKYEYIDLNYMILDDELSDNPFEAHDYD